MPRGRANSTKLTDGKKLQVANACARRHYEPIMEIIDDAEFINAKLEDLKASGLCTREDREMFKFLFKEKQYLNKTLMDFSVVKPKQQIEVNSHSSMKSIQVVVPGLGDSVSLDDIKKLNYDTSKIEGPKPHNLVDDPIDITPDE